MEEQTAPHITFFGFALVGFIILLVMNGLLFATVLMRVWANEADYRALRQELSDNQARWEAQNWENYRVTYTNCQNLFCCQAVPLEIENNYILQMPACASNGYGSYNPYYGSVVLTMSDVYRWMDEYMRQNRDNLQVRLVYDPQTAAITEIHVTEWGQEYHIFYDNLTPLE